MGSPRPFHHVEVTTLREGFHSNTLKLDRFLHILQFLCSTENNAEIEKQADNFDRIWKIRTIFDTTKDGYKIYYNPSAHLAFDKIRVIVKFKGRDIFRQYIPKKQTFRNQNLETL
jgi:hypothetical protein